MKKHIEIKTIEHKGISVIVKVDYDAGTATLVEAQPHSNPVVYQAKQWIFKNRTLEYMDGWLNILEAMAFAVKECKRDLEIKREEDRRAKEEMNNRMVGLIQEVGKEFVKHAKRPLPSPARSLKKPSNRRKKLTDR